MIPSLNGVSASCIVLPAGKWSSLLAFLIHKFPAVSEVEWVARFTRQEIRNADNEPLPLSSGYFPHQKVYYYRFVADEPIIPFAEKILFQDDLILVVDKPHFLPVVPSGRYVKETLLTRMKLKLGVDTIAPMHRIDKDTAGIVMFTLQPATRNAYQALFRHHQVKKEYHAIAPIIPSLIFPLTHKSRLEESAQYMQMHEVEGEINSETEVHLSERNAYWGKYVLFPSTGQKHQLRAHMSALGIPIKNDRIYPALLAEQPHENYFDAPLQLLAKAVTFIDPINGCERRFSSSQALNLDQR